ncbi:MAG: hypothetical protein WA888_13180 [Burkholderiaceae bacterium]
MPEIQNRIFLLAPCIWIAVGVGGCGSTPKAEAIKQFHEVASGVELTVDDYYFVSDSCQPAPFVLRVTSPARHGTIIVRPAIKKIAGQKSRFGNNAEKCGGVEVDSKQLVYQSRNGYVGPDSFEIYVRNDLNADQQRFVPYRIKVQQKTSAR